MTFELVLFDIDGTLLRCGPRVREIFRHALTEVYGTAGDLDGYDFSGRTDHQIVCELLEGAGLDPATIERHLELMKTTYLARLEVELRGPEMTLLPGVVELLERLAARSELALGLLTGNWESGGRTKLARFTLNRYFRFGAFGDGQRHRRALPPVALERAARLHGRPFRPETTLIVGDSPLDVDCARAHGIMSLAVATGRSSAAELAAAGADWVVGDLSQAGRDLPALG